MGRQSNVAYPSERDVAHRSITPKSAKYHKYLLLHMVCLGFLFFVRVVFGFKRSQRAKAFELGRLCYRLAVVRFQKAPNPVEELIRTFERQGDGGFLIRGKFLALRTGFSQTLVFNGYCGESVKKTVTSTVTVHFVNLRVYGLLAAITRRMSYFCNHSVPVHTGPRRACACGEKEPAVKAVFPKNRRPGRDLPPIWTPHTG